MPPARVKVAPGWEYRVLVMVLITDGLYLDSWDENYSSKSTQWVGVMNALSQPPLIALFLDLLWLDKPKPSSQRRGWLGGQELEPHLLTQVLLLKTYNPQLYREGTKKKAVIYGRTTGDRVSGTRKISRTRKATSMWTVKTKLHQLLRWNQSNSLCVGGSPGPSSLGLLKGSLQIVQSFLSKKLVLGSPTDANLVLSVQMTPWMSLANEW